MHVAEKLPAVSLGVLVVVRSAPKQMWFGWLLLICCHEAIQQYILSFQTPLLAPFSSHLLPGVFLLLTLVCAFSLLY